MALPLRHAVARPVDGRLAAWLGSLACLAAVNAGLWIWVVHATRLRTPYANAQLLLSGVYVAVCGFRSLFPRVDLERVCLWDTWLSAILLGRIVATIAELCFALQCALFLHRLAALADLPVLDVGARAFVPVVVIAELVCWYAVLSLNHIGHAIEESLWSMVMVLLAIAFATGAAAAHGSLRWALVAACVVYTAGAGLILVVDVRMYLRRWRRHAADTRLTLLTGLRDCTRRRHPTLKWEDWRDEVPWMTVYFSIGVWTSLVMVLLA